MNSKEFKRWLTRQGATFQAGKGSHLKVYLNGKQSWIEIRRARCLCTLSLLPLTKKAADS
jgi:mRNA interferase HicA